MIALIVLAAHLCCPDGYCEERPRCCPATTTTTTAAAPTTTAPAPATTAPAAPATTTTTAPPRMVDVHPLPPAAASAPEVPAPDRLPTLPVTGPGARLLLLAGGLLTAAGPMVGAGRLRSERSG